MQRKDNDILGKYSGQNKTMTISGENARELPDKVVLEKKNPLKNSDPGHSNNQSKWFEK